MLAWLSIDTWLITVLSIGYLCLLFLVAYKGQNQSPEQWRCKPWVYSLSLAVSCTSWAFYGTVGQAATTGAWLAPIYIGTILCLVLAWPMLMKMLKIIKRQNLTSIADFIAFRYDRSPKIAITVTLIALVGTIPYIALQLRAISTSFDLLTGTFQSGISTAFVVTVVLIVFSIFFGTRQIAASKQNQGLVLAIAFSSVVKLLALTAVGIFATFFVFDGFADLAAQQQNHELFTDDNSIYLALAQAILGAITIFVLPQQFHMMMIENHHPQELKTARWLFPLYFILINIFVLPIAIAGLITFPGGSVDADTYVLTLPLFFQQAWLGVVVYIGGLAAATSMVIVSAIVLSTMISTEVITPLTLKFKYFSKAGAPQFSGLLLKQRRLAITAILLFAFAFERSINQQSHLASIGLLSFVLLSQFAPAIIGALYWRKANGKGALTGLIVGSVMWFFTLLLPIIAPSFSWVQNGIFGLAWLKPTALFGVDFLDLTSHGVFYSLVSNIVCFVVVSLLTHRSVGEKLQADIFISKSQRKFERNLSTEDLYSLLMRFIDKNAADAFLQLAKSNQTNQNHLDVEPVNLIEYTRLQLSGVLGSASTRMVMKAASTSERMPLEDVVSIVDEANEMFRFNRELLQSGVENIEQGISVVDADMRLVAWNQRYIQLLDYPEGFVQAGLPIQTLLNFNISRGIIAGGANNDQMIAKRIAHMKKGDSHHFQRKMPNGIVLEIRGQSMPAGGFVSTFSDITAHIEAEKALQKANENLEKRVESRTQELQKAKAEAEAAYSSKSRFLAAASHDLMQPFNALSLFTSMLKNKVQGEELTALAEHIDDSLNVVEALLSDLVEISRLDSSSEKIEKSHFALDDLLNPLKNEFAALTEQANIKFSYQLSQCVVHSDKRMLRRIIQNFLSNAVHYCNDKQGEKAGISNRILLGIRRTKSMIRVEVWDNGPGIALAQQTAIFREFERLEQNREIPGLGLGLAISERIAKLLGLSISVKSQVGQGTCFSIEIPRVSTSEAAIVNTNTSNKLNKSLDTIAEVSPDKPFNNIIVLLIDNDELMLTAMASQLIDWGCRVLTAYDQSSCQQKLANGEIKPDIIIADYHLDYGNNGVELVLTMLQAQQWQLPTIICSADPSESVRQHTNDAEFLFLRKPIKSLALKRLMRQLLL
ncbi:hybrid sensor histidine kinase/response regulator [Colwellia sp. BRX10-3]|uniref:PAS domain-containing hybrid sensor histidine kinase/response regulator n=1 Tax=Colwellia sp. BRX10-3 TaxID=2759844 RepID=UPI0015F706CF|nr:PAS domain-containing hybrid sensor histidine kinase/response regulator [Colwellia sp. BRX10-3]MBA6392116.1 hybrid sensor histidine kinase/response regulator [Colwellia sp. BRX10-3]